MAKDDWPDARVSALRKFFGLVKLLFTGILLALFVAVDVGFVYQAVNESRDKEKFARPGEMVAVGSHRLHVQTMGEGSPTVVFESGLGGTSLDWTDVAPYIAKKTRVVVYDRAGLGWSQEGPHPRTSRQLAQELSLLLKNGGIEGPYLLVGHSFGGFTVRLFQHQQPHDVVGLVLVDASHEDQSLRFPSALKYWEHVQRVQHLALKGLSYPGGIRVLLKHAGDKVMPAYEGLNPYKRQALYALSSRPSTFRTLLSEWNSMAVSSEQVRGAGRHLGDLPVTIVSAGNGFQRNLPFLSSEEMSAVWDELQKEHAALSQRSRHLIAETSGHYVQLEDPGLVIQAIEEMINEIRIDSAAAPPPPRNPEPQQAPVVEEVDKRRAPNLTREQWREFFLGAPNERTNRSRGD